MTRGRIALALLVAAGSLAAAAAAPAQQEGPTPTGGTLDRFPAHAAPRFEVGFVYGLAVFTNGTGQAEWYDDAPNGARTDLETTPSLGATFAWAASANLRFAARATRQATRLVVENPDEPPTRANMILVHLHLDVELAFGGGATQPLLVIGGGGMHAGPDVGPGSRWHYSAAPGVGLRFAADDRVALRALVRVPLLWATGVLVTQIEPSVGAAFLF